MERGDIILIGIFLLILIIYLIPTFIAIIDKKDNKSDIILLNIFLGWTGIFWIISFYMAISNNKL